MADYSIRKNATAHKNNLRKIEKASQKIQGKENLLYDPLDTIVANVENFCVNVENFLDNVEKWKTFVEKWKTTT